jgi:hypothetical protein
MHPITRRGQQLLAVLKAAHDLIDELDSALAEEEDQDAPPPVERWTRGYSSDMARDDAAGWRWAVEAIRSQLEGEYDGLPGVDSTTANQTGRALVRWLESQPDVSLPDDEEEAAAEEQPVVPSDPNPFYTRSPHTLE